MTSLRPRHVARIFRWVLGLAAACAALTGCAPKTDVSVTSDVHSQYSHVYLTINGIWFNTSATATADDTTWQQFALSTPVTVDLASLSTGTLAQIASSLKIAAGTYVQIRLLPVDSSAALAASATTAGALYNAEADYVDSSGTLQRAQLELLNPEHGIGVTTSLTLKADTSAVLGNTTSTAASTPSVTDPTTGLPTTSGIDPTTGLPTTSPTTSTASTVNSNASTTATSSSTSTTPVSVAINLDGIHDVVQFNYGKQTAVLLNPHAAAFDTTLAGGITGTVDLTNVASSVDSSGNPNIEVTAETVSTDGSRHIAVKTVQVASGGTFTIYPLATTSTSSTNYDLVVHGPLIATAIVKSVPVPVGEPSSSTLVSVGTIEPRTTTSFAVNLATTTAPLPAGAFLNLYQTIPNSGEIPYLVEQAALDPFARTLFSDLSLSAGTLDYGSYVSGGNVSLTTVTPSQGTGVYVVSAQAPLFSDAALTTTVTQPSSGTATVLIAPPAMFAATGSTLDSLSLAVSAAIPGKYSQGELIVSHDGAVVQTVAIDSALAQNGGTTVQIPALPGGSGGTSFSSAVYYVSVRAWNSTNPSGSLHRQSYSTPVDLRGGSITGLTVSID